MLASVVPCGFSHLYSTFNDTVTNNLVDVTNAGNAPLVRWFVAQIRLNGEANAEFFVPTTERVEPGGK